MVVASVLDRVAGELLKRLVDAVGNGAMVMGLESAEAQVEAVSAVRGAVGVVFYYSFADVVALLCVLKRAHGLLGREFVAVCGDTAVGRAVRLVLTGMDIRTLPFRFDRQGLLFNDMKRLLKSSGSIAIAADGLGETGRVGVGLARLVRARNALAVPISVRADGAVRLSCLRGLQVPLSSAQLGVSVGDPVSCEGASGEVLGLLNSALASVRARARDISVSRIVVT